VVAHDQFARAAAQEHELERGVVVELDSRRSKVVFDAAGRLALPRHIETAWRWSRRGHRLTEKHRKGDRIPP
jgi:hypothetical protein